MIRLRHLLAFGTLLLAAPAVVPQADGPSATRGEVGLSLVLRKLATTGTVFHATAHPDDENNGLLAMQAHGEGLRVVLGTATRGNGGQNEIGPELFEALGVLRTEELAAAHRFDGAEQLFTRAVDFGYSFSIEESLERWGADEVLSDFVRLLRMTRPDIVVTMRPDGPGGGQHHQASARIATEAFRVAADPSRYPDQLDEGLRPWHARKLYQVGHYGFFQGEPRPADVDRLLPVDVEVYDPLLGRTYAEIGSQARAMHKCQGFGQLLALPGSFAIRYRLADTTLTGGVARREQAMTEGLDLSLSGLAALAGGSPPARLTKGLADIAATVAAADRALRTSGADETLTPLARGLSLTRDLLGWLETTPTPIGEAAAYEIAFRLRHTERKFVDALVLAQGLRLEALADDGVVVPGQPLQVRLIVANRGGRALRVTRLGVTGFDAAGPPCAADETAPGALIRCDLTVTVPADARVTAPYWHRAGEAGRYTFDDDAPFGLPFRPTPFMARLAMEIGGIGVVVDWPVVHRYEGNIFSGEKRMDLHVVPAITAAVTPEIAVVPSAPNLRQTPAPDARPDERTREVTVTVTNNAPSAADAVIRLDVPEGWRSEPASRAVRWSRADEAITVSFRVAPAPSAAVGEYTISAVAEAGGRRFDRGIQVIEYPHTRRRHVVVPAATRVKLIDVRLPEGLTVGYVMGVGDQVPPALEQIGARLVMLDETALASGDLSRFDAIVTGVRAYERRRDLRAYNQRLLEYAERGGTVLVQYNKFEFNQAQYAPFPAKVSSTRVTDEGSPVRLLERDHPAFTWPNRLSDRAWEGWVQERGLYFLGERDARYRDLLELEEPFAFNQGWKRGALVEAQVGKGRWVYVGLGLWRQLPAGTEGAYTLLANLVSLGRQAAGAAPAAARE
jgi:LmbE family N-acetylglucosaminyl deacetylase